MSDAFPGQGDLQGGGRHRQERRPVEGRPPAPWPTRHRGRLRPVALTGPRATRRRAVEDRGHLVVQRDPAAVLAAGADPAAEAEPEQRELLAERPPEALRTIPVRSRTYGSLRPRPVRPLPPTPRTRRPGSRFRGGTPRSDVRAPVAVVADGRRAHQHGRGRGQRRQRRASSPVPSVRLDRMSALRAGVQRLSPTPAPARWPRRRRARPPRVRPCRWCGPPGPRRPCRTAGPASGRRRSDQAGHPVATGVQGVDQCAADEARGAGEEDVHAPGSYPRTSPRVRPPVSGGVLRPRSTAVRTNEGERVRVGEVGAVAAPSISTSSDPGTCSTSHDPGQVWGERGVPRPNTAGRPAPGCRTAARRSGWRQFGGQRRPVGPSGGLGGLRQPIPGGVATIRGKNRPPPWRGPPRRAPVPSGAGPARVAQSPSQGRGGS